MTDLPVTNTLAPEHPKLSEEDHAQRRLGIAAGVQMFKALDDLPKPTDDTYDATHTEWLQVMTAYIGSLQSQPAAAQAGFLFVLADHLFQAEHGGGVQVWHTHQGGECHTNPPLTRTQMICDELCETEEIRKHRATGKVLEPRERAALARRWLAAAKRAKDVPLSKEQRNLTSADGKGAAVTMVDTLSRTSGDEEHAALDAYLRAYATAGTAAQSGFRRVLLDVLTHGHNGLNITATQFYAQREINGGCRSPRGREAQKHAARWLTARKRVKGTLPPPTTEAEGRARFVRMAAELRYLNGIRSRPVASDKLVEALMRDATAWPTDAHRGFAAMVSRWVEVEASGCGLDLEDEVKRFATAADKAHIAELARRECEELERIIARNEARAAAKPAARASSATSTAGAAAQA